MLHFKGAWRGLRSAPAFSLTAIVTLALALTANVYTFSIVDGLLFRALPYEQPDRLMTLRAVIPNENQAVPGAAVIASATSRGVLGIGGVTGTLSLTPLSPTDPTWRVLEVTENSLELLGISPLAGRVFQRGDGHRVGLRPGLISYASWKRRRGGDFGVIGRVIRAEKESVEIIGILPEGFFLPWVRIDPNVDLVVADHAFLPEAQENSRFLLPFLRLAPDASRESLQAELDSRLTPYWSSPDAGPRGHVEVVRTRDAVFAGWQPAAKLMLTAAIFLMLLAIINLAGLLLARGLGREREFAVRRALGARATHLIGQLAAEALFVTAIAGWGAYLLSSLAYQQLLSLVPATIAVTVSPQLSWRALALLFFMVALGVMLLTLVGASRSLRVDVRRALAGSRADRRPGRTIPRSGRAIVAIEMALGVMTLVLGVSAVAGLVQLASQPLGYEPTGLRAVRMTSRDGGKVAALVDASLAKLRTRFSDVEASDCDLFAVRCGALRGVSAGYLRQLGMRIRLGRDLSRDDVAGQAKVAVVTESLANARWPNQPALGQRLDNGDAAGFEVVGVVADLRRRRVEPPAQLAFVPIGARSDIPADARDRPGLTIVTRRGDVGDLVSALADTVRPEIPDARIAEVTMTDFEIPTPRMLAVLFGSFAVLGLIIAATGMLGLQLATVAAHRNDIAIRIAVGGAPARVARDFVVTAMVPVFFGVGLGLLFAWWISSAAASFLPDGQQFRTGLDSWSIAVFALFAVALFSALLPAWTASRRNPLPSLRSH